MTSADPPGYAAPASRRPARRWLWAGAVLAVVLVSTAAILAHYFVWPPSDHPTSADAVVVLSGDHGERLPVALALIRAGVAPVLVFDGDPDIQASVRLCNGGVPFEVVCLRPNPDDTRAEARAAGRLAAARGWRRLVVVTSTQHGTRAGVLFRRCVEGSVAVVRAHPPFDRAGLLHQVFREAAATAYVLSTSRGC